MKTKLKEYLDTVFADAERRAPYNQQVRELKEEMLQNLYDKYDDLRASGKTPSAAYNVAVTGVGDISDLLDSVVGKASDAETAGKTEPRPKGKRVLTPEEAEAVRKYKARSAVLTSVSVALYILCWIPLVILGALFQDIGGIVGLVLMFLMIAGATVMNIYNGMTKPRFDLGTDWEKNDDNDDNDDDDDDDDDDERTAENGRPRRNPVYKAISGALWILTVCVYLMVSFATGAWHTTWLIFLITTAVDNIIKAIFDLRR